MIKLIKKFKLSIILFGIFCLISLFFANYAVVKKSENFLYTDVNKIPFNNVGLILGTSKILKNGSENLYYKYRIEAAFKLYKAGKIKYFIISGDNSKKDYNEPLCMKTDLIANGIPDSVIYLDYAGFRTFDSMIRARDIFGQNQFTVISQSFHNQRAIYLARNEKINAIGFNAKDVDKRYGFKTNLREKFARVKMFIDLIFDKQPKFLGEKITIGKNSK